MAVLETVGVGVLCYWAGCGIASGALQLARGTALAAGALAEGDVQLAAHALAWAVAAPGLGGPRGPGPVRRRLHLRPGHRPGGRAPGPLPQRPGLRRIATVAPEERPACPWAGGAPALLRFSHRGGRDPWDSRWIRTSGTIRPKR